ncbi:sucrase ferredoxin [Nocardia inohanensis]|uniref:sucrase ferredoxin n=1 Tax=Nocardia inohanensis TaxID=209246 RepID=UPI00082BD78D|nr:sucrase ferredoxin [Nocardia inohanensis]
MTPYEGLSCSAAAQDIPLPGSATRVTGWLCVEQPGAWGRDVIGDEVLGPEITAELAARTKAAQVRPTLIRRPGRNEFTGIRTVLLAASRPEGSWCERIAITDLKQLLDIDLHLVNGPAPGIGAAVRDPLILVCAHGKRDQCCALLGRPIAARLADAFPDQVWECSHTGGHRFAPAMVVLPTGLTYGRLDGDAAARVVEAARHGEVELTGFRGRSCYSPVEQVAEIAVRQELTDETFTRHPTAAVSPAAVADSADVENLLVTPAPEGSATERDPATFAGAALVTHRDGRRWLVTARTEAHTPRQASCGASPKPATAIVADTVRRLR